MKTKRMARKVRPSFAGRTALSSDLVRKEGMGEQIGVSEGFVEIGEGGGDR